MPSASGATASSARRGQRSHGNAQIGVAAATGDPSPGKQREQSVSVAADSNKNWAVITGILAPVLAFAAGVAGLAQLADVIGAGEAAVAAAILGGLAGVATTVQTGQKFALKAQQH